MATAAVEHPSDTKWAITYLSEYPGHPAMHDEGDLTIEFLDRIADHDLDLDGELTLLNIEVRDMMPLIQWWSTIQEVAIQGWRGDRPTPEIKAWAEPALGAMRKLLATVPDGLSAFCYEDFDAKSVADVLRSYRQWTRIVRRMAKEAQVGSICSDLEQLV